MNERWQLIKESGLDYDALPIDDQFAVDSLISIVAAHEREACAKVADSICDDKWALYLGRPPYTGKEPERASDYMQGKAEGAGYCAEAIRARGEK
jgi:hypothetical protein